MRTIKKFLRDNLHFFISLWRLGVEKTKIIFKESRSQKSLLLKNEYFILGTIILVIIFFLFAKFENKDTTDKIQTKVNTRTIVLSTAVDQSLSDFYLKIPKINVTAPILQNVDPANKSDYDEKLADGVALMPKMALPGEKGNIFIYGHSSAVEHSSYEEIFAHLNDLNTNDEIDIKYNNRDFSYKVVSKKIVDKNDLSVLDPTPDETLNLMTCWPIGTNNQRLIISAKRK
jgi:sortase A